MNHAVVVDASVALKWVVFEEFTDHARALYHDALLDHRPILVPPHFPSEATSALYQRTRTRQPARALTEDEAYEALTWLSRFPLAAAGSANLYERGFLFARDHRLPSLYDSLYVVLAQLLNAELWTADKRLHRAVARVAPWVRFISEYPTQ
jgi:predicted nucleic acid-binding protein